MIRGELEVLKDWCYEAVSAVFEGLLFLIKKGVSLISDQISIDVHFFFCFIDLQSAGTSHSTGQGYGAAVSLQDS